MFCLFLVRYRGEAVVFDCVGSIAKRLLSTTGACLFSFRGSKGAISARCGGRFFALSEAGFRWCLAVLSPSPRGCRLGFVRARLRDVFCLRTGACLFSFRGSKGAISARCGGRFFASSEAGFRWCLAVLSPSPKGCRLGFVRARLRHVFLSTEWGLFRGSKGAISARCGGRFFASSEAGFRWCLAVLSPSPRGCRLGFVRARLRDVFCLRTGACLFSFRGSKGAISARCGGRFFASSEAGFRWCLAVLSPSPRGCRLGFVRARLRDVFCLRTGACLFSFRGSKGAISARCGGRFFASSEAGFRCGVWLFWVHRREVASWGLSGLGCVTFSVYGLGLVSSPLGVPKVLFRHAAEDGFLLCLRPDLGGVWLFGVHRREVAAWGLSGLGCVTFSVYGLGLVSSPL